MRRGNLKVQRVGWARVAYASLVPFLAAALLGSLVFRASRGPGATRGQAVVQRHPVRQVLEEALPCAGSNCDLQATLVARGDGSPEAGQPAPDGGSGGGAATAAAAGVSTAPGDLPKLFLFIGILSGRGYRHRRLAVREAWSTRAQIPGTVVSKFILSEDERTPQVEKELEAYGDIVFVREKTNYKSILYKTYYVLEYAAQNYDAAFVLKTDDDAFINVPHMVTQLRAMCENPGCVGERLYLGRMAKHSEVLLQPGHKWNNAAFHNHTGLREYPNYMMGGGYAVSGEVARVLVEVHQRMHLKFTPIEDATLGFWLMAMDLRHIDHPRFYTWAAPCCFKAPVRKPGERFVTRFQLNEEFEAGLCSSDPWLILHKIDSPTKMRYVGARVANCSDPEPWLMPESIEEYVPQATLQHWAEQRKEHLRAAGLPADPPRAPRPPPPARPAAGSTTTTSITAAAAAAAARVSAARALGVKHTASRADIAAALQAASAAGKLSTSMGSTAHLGRLGAAGAAGAAQQAATAAAQAGAVQAAAAATQAGATQADSAATQAGATQADAAADAAAAAFAAGTTAGASGGGATLAGGAATGGAAADAATLGAAAVQR